MRVVYGELYKHTSIAGSLPERRGNGLPARAPALLNKRERNGGQSAVGGVNEPGLVKTCQKQCLNRKVEAYCAVFCIYSNRR